MNTIYNISHLISLTNLSLANKNLTEITGLQTITNLRHLNLSHNYLDKTKTLTNGKIYKI